MRRATHKISFFVFLFPLASACGFGAQKAAEEATIVGANDLTPVGENGIQVPEKYRGIINAFGLVSMGCTATHIGNGFAITAGHCFQRHMSAEKTENAPCKETSIQWGFRKIAPPAFESQCELIIASEWSHFRDFAVIKLNNVPPVFVPMDLSSRPQLNTKITIFGYPLGRPLQWSKTCAILPPVLGRGVEQFSHECDTEPGSSGSAILDDTSLKIIGIHNGFAVPSNYGTYLVGTPVEKLAVLVLSHE
jgi:V8-like Glu-specific endopeptidase